MQKSSAVIFIITKLELGGAQKVCLALYQGFKQHTNTYLFCGKGGILDKQVEQDPNVLFLKFMSREVYLIGLIFDFLALLEIIFQIKKVQSMHQQIIVHTHSSKAGLLGRIAAKIAGVKLIVHTVHGFAINPLHSKIKQKIFLAFEQLGTWCCDRIVCVSKQDLDFGSKYIHTFASKASIIRAAVEDKFFSQDIYDSVEKEKIIIGTISCFKKQKNLQDLIMAFAILKKSSSREFELEIIGDGEERKIIEDLIKKLNLEASVKLLSWQKDVITHLRRWKIFALSSLWEGLPCSVIQAQLLRLFCVCYDTGGIGEAIIPGKTGFVVKNKNPASLAYFLSLAIEKNFEEDLQETKNRLNTYSEHFMIEKTRQLFLTK